MIIQPIRLRRYIQKENENRAIDGGNTVANISNQPEELVSYETHRLITRTKRAHFVYVK